MAELGIFSHTTMLVVYSGKNLCVPAIINNINTERIPAVTIALKKLTSILLWNNVANNESSHVTMVDGTIMSYVNTNTRFSNMCEPLKLAVLAAWSVIYSTNESRIPINSANNAIIQKPKFCCLHDSMP